MSLGRGSTDGRRWSSARSSGPFRSQAGDGPGRVLVTDQAVAPAPGLVVLHPPSLVVGVGASTDAPAGAARALLDETLAETGLARAVGRLGRDHRPSGRPTPSVVALGLPGAGIRRGDLGGQVDVPNPSAIVAAEVGTPSVAEAAALAAAGAGAELVVTKRKAATVTIADRAAGAARGLGRRWSASDPVTPVTARPRQSPPSVAPTS